MKNLPKNEKDFLELMEEIDESLKNKGVRIQARELQTYREIAKRFKIRVPIVGPEKAIPGIYSGESLSGHIAKWYIERYGDKMKVSYSFGNVVILIKRDPYRMSIPMFFVQKINLVCDKTLTVYPSTGIYDYRQQKKVYVFNVLQCIDGMTRNLAAILNETEQREIITFFTNTLNMFSKLVAKKDLMFLDEAKADLQMAVDNILYERPQFGQSRWSTLQFAEKIMKSFLLYYQKNFPHTHDLSRLAKLFENYGVDIPKYLIDNIQCSADARYDNTLADLNSAVKAHHASLELAAFLINNVI